MKGLHIFFFLLLFIQPLVCLSQPDASMRTVIDGVVIYRDHFKQSTFYYIPSDLKLVYNENGKPDVRFVQMVYTGTKAAGNQGEKRFKSLLQFKVQQGVEINKKVRLIKEKLENEANKIELLPIPIYDVKTVLVYAAIDGSNSNDSNPFLLSEGSFSEEGKKNSSNSVWNERMYTMTLDNNTSQVFWDAFERKGTILSVGFTFFSKFLNDSLSGIEYVLEGTDSLAKEFEKYLPQEEVQRYEQMSVRIIKSSAFTIEADLNQWPDLAEKIDINQLVPSEFPVVEVRCYDFRNELRNDLYGKKIEFIAKAQGGGTTKSYVLFLQTKPGEYVQYVKFKQAVLMSEPLQYRVIEIYQNRPPVEGKWKETQTWSQLVDITGPSE